MFEMVKEFQNLKEQILILYCLFVCFQNKRKKEKELYKNKVLELAVKYPDKK